MPTLLMIGDADTTAIGSDIAPPKVKARIGHYDDARQGSAAIFHGGALIEFPGLGHALRFKSRAAFIKHCSACCCDECEQPHASYVRMLN